MHQDIMLINSRFRDFDNWLNYHGFSGYDPYDIKGSPIVIQLTQIGNKNKIFALFREIIFEIFYMAPWLFRKLFHIKPTYNAKAMALFASAYLDLYRHFKDEPYLQKAENCLKWLKENSSHTTTGLGWGYPFNWQSKMLIPAGTPNGIVTTVVGEAFWKHYQVFGDQESLDFCLGICKFLSSLPVDQLNQDQICFSYTPLFINHVHNLNLFVAEFLIKIGQVKGNAAWIEMGNHAVNYTLANQLMNGAFDYNGSPEKPQNHYDNYHTGFVLRMLHSIWKLTDRKDVYNSLEKCYHHYITAFFEDKRIPKLMPDKKYRIDIHSCAESVNCLSELSSTFPEGFQLAGNILKWTIDHLQDKSGYFYYGIIKSRFTGIPFKSKIPYIRWSQAWMLKALTSYIILKDQKNQ